MRRLARVDAALSALELKIAALLLAAMLAVIAAGAGLRTLGRPLVWGDELAVQLMALSALFGISANIARGGHVTVDLVSRRLPRAARLPADLVLFAATLGFAICLWRWFDPVGLIRLGSAGALARETMNFVYEEPTMTLGLGKHWFWLAFVPATAGAGLHALVRLLRGPAPC